MGLAPEINQECSNPVWTDLAGSQERKGNPESSFNKVEKGAGNNIQHLFICHFAFALG